MKHLKSGKDMNGLSSLESILSPSSFLGGIHCKWILEPSGITLLAPKISHIYDTLGIECSLFVHWSILIYLYPSQSLRCSSLLNPLLYSSSHLSLLGSQASLFSLYRLTRNKTPLLLFFLSFGLLPYLQNTFQSSLPISHIPSPCNQRSPFPHISAFPNLWFHRCFQCVGMLLLLFFIRSAMHTIQSSSQSLFLLYCLEDSHSSHSLSSLLIFPFCIILLSSAHDFSISIISIFPFYTFVFRFRKRIWLLWR